MNQRIDELLRAEDSDKQYVSFEFLPPRSEEAQHDFLNVRIPQFIRQDPVFIDITWGAGGSTSGVTMAITKTLQAKYPGIPVNMHLTCTNMKKKLVMEALEFAKENGIRNILALRGDPPKGKEFQAEEGLSCALDLVTLIREKYGDYFCITVAGYPEGHPSKISDKNTISENDYKDELEYLKKKVDAGADIIITQLFYDAKLFIRFVQSCREIGITVPILPGLMPFTTYNSLKRMVELCKTSLNQDIKTKIEALKEDPEAFLKYGVTLTFNMIKEIQAANIGANHFHIFTINTIGPTFGVLGELGMFKE